MATPCWYGWGSNYPKYVMQGRCHLTLNAPMFDFSLLLQALWLGESDEYFERMIFADLVTSKGKISLRGTSQLLVKYIFYKITNSRTGKLTSSHSKAALLLPQRGLWITQHTRCATGRVWKLHPQHTESLDPPPPRTVRSQKSYRGWTAGLGRGCSNYYSPRSPNRGRRQE